MDDCTISRRTPRNAARRRPVVKLKPHPDFRTQDDEEDSVGGDSVQSAQEEESWCDDRDGDGHGSGHGLQVTQTTTLLAVWTVATNTVNVTLYLAKLMMLSLMHFLFWPVNYVKLYNDNVMNTPESELGPLFKFIRPDEPESIRPPKRMERMMMYMVVISSAGIWATRDEYIYGGQASTIPEALDPYFPIHISFRGVGCTVAGVEEPVLQNVTGSILPGRITGILGPSGSGKTTLISSILGKTKRYCVQAPGQVYLNGSPRSLDTFLDRVGFVPQEDIMYSELTVEETILFNARWRLPLSTTEEQLAGYLNQTLETMNLIDIRHQRMGEGKIKGLSGGQKKRVSIAKELITRPSVLVMDEPTTGLDSAAAFQLMQTLRGIASNGVSVVTILHRPSSRMFQLLDDVILLQEGQAVYVGPRQNLHSYFSSLGFQWTNRIRKPSRCGPTTTSEMSHVSLNGGGGGARDCQQRRSRGKSSADEVAHPGNAPQDGQTTILHDSGNQTERSRIPTAVVDNEPSRNTLPNPGGIPRTPGLDRGFPSPPQEADAWGRQYNSSDVTTNVIAAAIPKPPVVMSTAEYLLDILAGVTEYPDHIANLRLLFVLTQESKHCTEFVLNDMLHQRTQTTWSIDSARVNDKLSHDTTMLKECLNIADIRLRELKKKSLTRLWQQHFTKERLWEAIKVKMEEMKTWESQVVARNRWDSSPADDTTKPRASHNCDDDGLGKWERQWCLVRHGMRSKTPYRRIKPGLEKQIFLWFQNNLHLTWRRGVGPSIAATALLAFVVGFVRSYNNAWSQRSLSNLLISLSVALLGSVGAIFDDDIQFVAKAVEAGMLLGTHHAAGVFLSMVKSYCLCHVFAIVYHLSFWTRTGMGISRTMDHYVTFVYILFLNYNAAYSMGCLIREITGHTFAFAHIVAVGNLIGSHVFAYYSPNRNQVDNASLILNKYDSARVVHLLCSTSYSRYFLEIITLWEARDADQVGRSFVLRYFGYKQENKSVCVSIMWGFTFWIQSIRALVFFTMHSSDFHSLNDTPLFLWYTLKVILIQGSVMFCMLCHQQLEDIKALAGFSPKGVRTQ